MAIFRIVISHSKAPSRKAVQNRNLVALSNNGLCRSGAYNTGPIKSDFSCPLSRQDTGQLPIGDRLGPMQTCVYYAKTCFGGQIGLSSYTIE